MFGAETTGDTSGYGGLHGPAAAGRCPARGPTARTSTTWPTRSAASLERAGLEFGDAVERVVADRGELTFHVRR